MYLTWCILSLKILSQARSGKLSMHSEEGEAEWRDHCLEMPYSGSPTPALAREAGFQLVPTSKASTVCPSELHNKAPSRPPSLMWGERRVDGRYIAFEVHVFCHWTHTDVCFISMTNHSLDCPEDQVQLKSIGLNSISVCTLIHGKLKENFVCIHS